MVPNFVVYTFDFLVKPIVGWVGFMHLLDIFAYDLFLLVIPVYQLCRRYGLSLDSLEFGFSWPPKFSGANTKWSGFFKIRNVGNVG